MEWQGRVEGGHTGGALNYENDSHAEVVQLQRSRGVALVDVLQMLHPYVCGGDCDCGSGVGTQRLRPNRPLVPRWCGECLPAPVPL